MSAGEIWRNFWWRVDEGEALLEEGVFDFAGFGSFGVEWASSASGVFGEKDGDGFAVGGPARSVDETFRRQ